MQINIQNGLIMKNNYHFIFDQTKQAFKIKKKLLRKYKNYPLKKSDKIIVSGGDGFMLRILKKYHRSKKPFYGINCGTVGFLMNKFDNMNLDKKINRSKSFLINPLEIKVLRSNKKKQKMLAINEISLFRQSRQTAILNIKINNKIFIKRLIGDGALVCTPAGSTAYNLSINGPILSFNSKKIAITPISSFRPRRLKGKVVPDSSRVTVENLDSKKRPVAAVADNSEIRNIKNVQISINKQIRLHLLFDSGYSLPKKIKLEQNKNSKI